MPASVFQPRPMGQRPDWQEVLQKPYLNEYAQSPSSIISARESAMTAANNTQLAALNAALQAQRDKALADYIAAHTPHGSGGGGGGGHRGGGGGSAPGALLDALPVPESYMPTYPDSTPPPAYNPSTYLTPNSVYAKPPDVKYKAPTSNKAGSGRLAGAIKAKPKVVSKSKVILS